MTPHLKVCGQGQAAKKGHIYFQGRVARDVVLGLPDARALSSCASPPLKLAIKT